MHGGDFIIDADHEYCLDDEESALYNDSDEIKLDMPPEGYLSERSDSKSTLCSLEHVEGSRGQKIRNGDQIEDEPTAIHVRDSLQTQAQEPWPKDVRLFQPYEVEQILLPDNANCLAVQAFLKMCGLDFEIESRANAEAMSPSGKVPFIKAGAFVIAELEGIVQFVNGKGISLTSNLEAEQKNDMRAYMSLVHNVLENAELYICWCDKETYNEVTKPRNGSIYPWPLNYIQTWTKRAAVIKRLKLLGWYQKSLQEVYQEVENCCQALTDRLEGRQYFFGDNVSELDALVYGHILSILTTPIPTDNNAFGFLIKKFKRLVTHCKKIDSLIMGRHTDLTVKHYKRNKSSVRFSEKIDFHVDDDQDSVNEQCDLLDDSQMSYEEFENIPFDP